MFCTNCGEKHESNIKFCSSCGQSPSVKFEKSFFQRISQNEKLIPVSSVIGLMVLSAAVYAYSLANTTEKHIPTELTSIYSPPPVEATTENAQAAKVEEVSEIPKIENLAYVEPLRVPADTNTYSVSEIVRGWQNRIAQVTCTNSKGEEMFGTATLVTFEQEVTAVSNDHVIDDGSGYWPSACAVGIYGLGGRVVTYNPTRFTSYREYGLDYALVNLNNPDYSTDEGTFDIVAKNYMPICQSSEVGIGDEIVILGYPWNGSQSSVTASRGIVSGYDNNYYVTDAKIEQGNSGGAAILMKNNCWLGIPTASVVGGIESYGRILKGEIVLE